MKNYILLYGEKKLEDNILLKNMFENNEKINIGWTDFDTTNNLKKIEEIIEENKELKQIIFAGLELGWDKLIVYIKEKYGKLKIKVICNTTDSLLYYEYERNNFFRLLELSKENKIDNIAFLRRGQYEVYNKLGYKCSFLRQNYILDKKKKKEIKQKNDIIDIGIYPLNYTWDENIFNQLCVGEMLEKVNINYNALDKRMKEFLDTMQITNTEDKIEKVNEDNIINKLVKNDINISCAFTKYLHTIFFISMELGIPCLIGNTSDLFEENEEIKKYIVTLAEDNAIINAQNIEKCLGNKEKINTLYLKWKNKYNLIAQKSIEKFINE